MTRRKKSARTYLASIYSRMSRAAQSGLRRLRGRANRAGPEHLAADAQEFAYIEREAHDILAAIARLRAMDAAEAMPATEYAPEALAPVETYELAEHYEPAPMTLGEYGPETMATAANQARGRRRRRNAAGATREDRIRKLRAELQEATEVFRMYARMDSLTEMERREKEGAYRHARKVERALARMGAL